MMIDVTGILYLHVRRMEVQIVVNPQRACAEGYSSQLYCVCVCICLMHPTLVRHLLKRLFFGLGDV